MLPALSTGEPEIGDNVGGLAGGFDRFAYIKDSYATGAVDGGTGANDNIGALRGDTDIFSVDRSYYSSNATVQNGEIIALELIAGTPRTIEALRYPSTPTYSSGSTVASFASPATQEACNALLGPDSWSTASNTCPLPNRQASCEGVGLNWTEAPNARDWPPGTCAGPVRTYVGWDADNWDFGTSSQYPAVKDTNGDLICGQPGSRAQCE